MKLHRPNRVELLRKQRGWTMDELASRCRGAAVKATQINKIEKRKQELTAEWIYRLADALEVHWSEIFEEPRLTPEERAVLGLYRGLAEPERRTAFRVLNAMAQPQAETNATAEPDQVNHNK